jgi:AcrR family transcriptional regulator
LSTVTVHGIARKLGIAKSGFYWHFRNRDDLLHQLLDYWSYQLTEIVASNVKIIALEPKARLVKIAQMILDHDLTRHDLAIRQWARQDPEVAKVVRKVNRIRLDFLRWTFAELGFEGEDLEIRTMLFVCYHTWETPMFPEISRKRRHAQIVRRIEILISR